MKKLAGLGALIFWSTFWVAHFWKEYDCQNPILSTLGDIGIYAGEVPRIFCWLSLAYRGAPWCKKKHHIIQTTLAEEFHARNCNYYEEK